MLLRVLKYSCRPLKNVINAQSSSHLFNQFNTSNFNFNRFYAVYGNSSLKEHRHARIINNIGVVDDEEPDCFIDIEKFQEIEAQQEKPYDSRDFNRALNSSLQLKRFKLGISIVDFLLTKNISAHREVVNIFKLISEAYTHHAISYEKGQELVEKLMPFLQNLPSHIFAQLNETAMLFSKKENGHGTVTPEDSVSLIPEEHLFVTLLTHAIRRRDIDEMRKLAVRFPSLSAYGTPMLYEWFQWVDESPSQAAQLVKIFFDSMKNSDQEHSSEFFENFIDRYNKISHLPSFVKVELEVNRRCSNCLSKFDPKPTFTDEEFAEFSKSVSNYAKYRLIPSKELDRIELTCKRLLNWKKNDPFAFPICLADVPNMIYGEKFLGNIKLLKIFVEQMLGNFSAVGLISKFSLPSKIAREISQLNKVFYFMTHKTSIDDDTVMFLMYAKCGKDTYFVTNDQFRDHLKHLENSSIPEARLQKILGIRSLRMNKTAGFLEKPTEISPFVQQTLTGYHIPLRRTFVTAKENYEYYCCHKLF